jgi:hypothetical protein
VRFHRWVYLIGWTGVTLLAIAGFAAFSTVNGNGTVAGGSNPWGATAGAVSAQSVLVASGVGISSPPPALLEGAADPAVSTPKVVAATRSTAPSRHTGWLSSVEVRELVSRYFLPGDVNRGVRTAWCASRFDPDLVDPQTGATGLFGLGVEGFADLAEAAGMAGSDPTHPETNTAVAAFVVYHGEGWSAFGSCSG